MSHDGEGTAIDADVIGTRSMIYGYRKPDIKLKLFDNDTLVLLEHNDPDIVGLVLDCNDAGFREDNPDDDDDDGNFQRLGRAIGNSRHIRTVKILRMVELNASHRGLLSFFTGLSHNTTIEYLTIDGLDDDNYDTAYFLFRSFLSNNHKLRRLRIRDCSFGVVSSFLILQRAVMNGLISIDLSHNNIGDDIAADLIDACGLHQLLDLNVVGNVIQKKGCKALGSLLNNSASRIHYLAIGRNDINDECMNILIAALLVNSTLKTLDYENGQYLTSAGWRNFSTFLSDTRCSIENLILGAHSISDDDFKTFGRALTINKTLKCLCLHGHFDITQQGWREFLTCLRSNHSALREFSLSDCFIGDDTAISLFSALATNTALAKLKMKGIYTITLEGWCTCFRSLEDSNSVLEELDFSNVNLTDGALVALSKLLLDHIATVRSLRVFNIPTISRNGWSILACVLDHNSASKLKELIVGGDLGENSIVDAVFSVYAVALQNNTSLEVLKFGAIDITEECFQLLLSTLCDFSSISTVYDSNHSLIKFDCDSTDYTKRLQLMMKINNNKNKLKVVQTKTFMYFISDIEHVAQVFDSISTPVLPHAIGCIGKNSDVGIPILYNVFKTNPWIFDV